LLEDSCSDDSLPLPEMDRSFLGSDDTDFHDPDLGKIDMQDYTKYLPPIIPRQKIHSIVPKDSLIQMKGFAPNQRLDVPSQVKTIG
jgi:hypothetical protein